MKPIGEIFDSLTHNYSNDFKEIESTGASTAYAPVDFFNLEPFYYTLNGIKKELCSFYKEPEELPEGSDIFLCLLAESRLIFAREYLNDYLTNTF
jgi:hypothetical protein